MGIELIETGLLGIFTIFLFQELFASSDDDDDDGDGAGMPANSHPIYSPTS